MKRFLSKIKWWGSFLLVILGLIESFTKTPVFFRPLWFYFNQNIEIKFGILVVLEFLILLFVIIWIRNNKKIRQLENVPDTASNKRWKTSFEEFPGKNILYGLEYPLDKEDVEPWIHKSDPRCLKCRIRMKKVLVNHNPFVSSKWICESCEHSIEENENIKLQTQAKSRLIKRLKSTGS